MMSKTERLERDILRVFRCACGQERLDIAEFMLAALEKLDSEREDIVVTGRPLMEAYMDVADNCGSRRFLPR
jgi:ATP:corrinoid adenosyltransferase